MYANRVTEGKATSLKTFAQVTGCLTILFVESVLAEDPPVEVPFEMSYHLILVEVSIGDFHNLRFAVDTGATHTYIAAWLADKLGLQGKTGKVIALGRKTRVSKVMLPEIRIASLTLRSVEARVHDQLGGGWGIPIDGLIGVDLLKRTGITINYKTKTLTLGSPVELPSSMKFYPSILYVVVRVQTAEGSISMLLDSGAGETMLYRERVTGKISWRSRYRKRKIQSVSGVAFADEVQLAELVLGDTRWDRFVAYILDQDRPSLEGVDGVLSISALSLKRLSIDFENGIVSWER